MSEFSLELELEEVSVEKDTKDVYACGVTSTGCCSKSTEVTR